MPLHYNTLIATEQLARFLDTPDWVICDCRFNLADAGAGERAYKAGHIPGARYAHLDRDLSSPITSSTGRHPLPDPDELARKLGGWGIGRESQVVVYDDCGGAMAVRLWWLLRWLGHERVAVLDGGWQKWCAEGRPVNADLPCPEMKEFRGTPDDGLWLSTDELRAGLEDNSLLLIDTRSAERFRGDQEPIDPVAGHIPGAVNLPLQRNLREQGTFHTAASLRGLYEEILGDRSPNEVVHMCGSGVTACHNLLAMELVGLHGSKLYPGSWSEWIRDPMRPIATCQP